MLSLSRRGVKSAASQDIPWRFAPGGNNRYDAVSNPTGVISLATAENNLMHHELCQFVDKNVSIPQLAYTYRFSTMGGPRFPVAMAAHVNEYFKPFSPISADDIITASGLTAMHELIGFSLGDPGDGILVSRPVYGRFELDFGNTSGLNIVYADMPGIDPFSPEAIQQYQAAFDLSVRSGVLIKAVLIVNPNNPTGRTYSTATLKALMAFCGKNNLHLISDEVYALSTYSMGKLDEDSEGFVSVLSIDPRGLINEDYLHVLYGMSKDFAAAGLRLGSLITRNLLLRKAVACNMRFHNPSGMSVAIGTAILEDRDFVSSFISLSRQRLKESREYTLRVLDAAGIRYEHGNAGFFVFIDLSPWLEAHDVQADEQELNREFLLAQKLLDAGVGLHPCEEHADKPGQFRLVFSQEREVLSEGLRRLIAVLETIDRKRSLKDTAKTNGFHSEKEIEVPNGHSVIEVATAQDAL